MGKKNKLTADLRRDIRQKSREGMNGADIAKAMNLHPSTISRVLKSSSSSRPKKQGRPRKLDERYRLRLARTSVANPYMSKTKICNSLKLPCSPRTVSRELRRRGFTFKTWTKGSQVSQKNQLKRVAWARAHSAWMDEWLAVIFTDEKKWNLCGPDGVYQAWRRDHNLPLNGPKPPSGSVMTWGAISATGGLALVRMKGIYNSQRYLELIEKDFLNNVDVEIPAGSIFQQDGAPIHTSRAAMARLKELELDPIEWPPQSPDLSPIENVWSLVEQRVYKDGMIFRRANDLFEAIKKEWSLLTAADLAPLYYSLHDRCLDVIAAQGRRISY